MGKKSRRQRDGPLYMKPHERMNQYEVKLTNVFARAMESDEVQNILQTARAKSERDEDDLREYMNLRVFRLTGGEGDLPGCVNTERAVKSLRRWARLAPYWPRIRRRICDQCGRQVALSEPRFMVCGGCGVARYCSEACQIASWGHHQKCCVKLARYATRQKKLAAASDPAVV